MTKRGLYLLALDCNLGTLKKDNVAKLNSNAKRQAQGFGTWLALHKSKPDLVICEADTLVKAYTEKLVKAMGATAELVESTAMLPVDGSADLLRLYLLRKIDQLLVVANEKPIRLLGNELLIDNGHLQQNSLLCLKVANPSPAAATEKMEVDIDNIVVANELPNQFPFPDINGSELRPRPAYYYRQSAVIPFRSSEQGIELLLISSSNRRHWLIPKGIHEPGMSAQASALKEAVEEGGISGQALDYLGKYEYQKWGGRCVVKVYPMQVTAMLPDDAWLENHRQRRWCSPDLAKQLIKHQALVPMIDKLQQRYS